jgi:hypothetical protein
MTTKRAKPKPVKMWATVDDDGFPFEATRAFSMAKHWRFVGERVVRVLVTPIEPKRKMKK